MYLKNIKLSGFKSFVDPVTATFPSNMVAVIGPNGCGKSNIIDAVRWVMGESSAKNLRGESMTDVIFNGSNTRQPVNQATIELVFDNSDNRLLGEFSRYNEVSVRRKVTREGQSQYFLNGNKCRRRDISDVFLGTGLGPRSYSIIEQGMITKLIEAKPEELRLFIEEAAGVSKYKERRRETETRIRRTQENLARLIDLQTEADRQLERLDKQAKTAKKYQSLKEQEYKHKANLLALRWNSFNKSTRQYESSVKAQETRIETLVAAQYVGVAHIDSFKLQLESASESFNQEQANFYRISAEIANIEQSIKHVQQRSLQLKKDLDQTNQDYEKAQSSCLLDKQKLVEVSVQLDQLEPKKEALHIAIEEIQAVLDESKVILYEKQEKIDTVNERKTELNTQKERSEFDIKRLTYSLQQLTTRDEKSSTYLESISNYTDSLDILKLSEDSLVLEEKKEQQLLLESSSSADLLQLDLNLDQLWAVKQEKLTKQQQIDGEIASFELLKKEHLSSAGNVDLWLEQHQLHRKKCLLECIKIADGWEWAVEVVLEFYLQSIVLDNPEQFNAANYSLLQQGRLCLVTQGTPVTINPHSLLAKVQKSPVDLSPWLHNVCICNSLQEALEKRVTLSNNNSLITQDGCWVGSNFLYMHRQEKEQVGSLTRQRVLEGLYDEKIILEDTLSQIDDEISIFLNDKEQKHKINIQARQQLQQIVQKTNEIEVLLATAKAKQEQILLQKDQIELELLDIRQQYALEKNQLNDAHEQQKSWDLLIEDNKSQYDELKREHSEQQLRVDNLLQEFKTYDDEQHVIDLRFTELKAQKKLMRQAVERSDSYVDQLQKQKEKLLSSLESETQPNDSLALQLDSFLEKRLLIEGKLKYQQDIRQQIENSLRDLEQNRFEQEKQLQDIKDQLVDARMKCQEYWIKRNTVKEQIDAEKYDLDSVLAALPDDLSEISCEESLAGLAFSINRLGSINLMAVDEYQQQVERKTYLINQCGDLEQALQILESVIYKIDEETRFKFKNTFDQINIHLQQLFPSVFGGGKAYLELVGEDLLSTGVTIMARPPGKKNSTIHLLSGGEKALTALALVFSIFRLNPAPFCMLDEVDAPLDDANVGRYARLVKEMSDTVQFIYITHNKISMEMADHLLGITMHEAGCSRLVAVDIEEAVSMID